VAPPRTAWLQTDLKWEKAPATINPRLRTSTAAILYFGEDHTFALMYRVVNQVPGEYTTIRNGSGLAFTADSGPQIGKESQSGMSSFPPHPDNGQIDQQNPLF
jgi:hypothetical protein